MKEKKTAKPAKIGFYVKIEDDLLEALRWKLFTQKKSKTDFLREVLAPIKQEYREAHDGNQNHN